MITSAQFFIYSFAATVSSQFTIGNVMKNQISGLLRRKTYLRAFRVLSEISYVNSGFSGST